MGVVDGAMFGVVVGARVVGIRHEFVLGGRHLKGCYMKSLNTVLSVSTSGLLRELMLSTHLRAYASNAVLSVSTIGVRREPMVLISLKACSCNAVYDELSRGGGLCRRLRN